MDSAAAGRGGRRQTCPRCGTGREAGSAPACGCAERAGDAGREARSAEAAAAEDFDPLRIRPYVTLPEPAAGATEPMPVVAPPVGDAPRSADVGLFASRAPEGDLPPPEVSYGAYDEPEPRRGRRAWYAGVGAAVAVVTLAVLAAGVFSSDDEPRRDRALPDAPTSAVDVPSGSARPSGSASASASRSAAPSPSRTSSAAASTPAPSATRSTARATGSVEPKAPASGQVLRRGDRGAEVVDLQERLQQLSLYEGEAHGNFNAPVASALTRFQVARDTADADGEGVYGAATRAALEAETTP
ncbi:peptidoglycan-binding domain-containing protein [Streptomyces sp. NPDC021622]|uniref:peptidoglycan-binding domain-containing protein n=1 Tax=Streptomyces sp. NPDC021622 TaxID=3155013 RepID=UPI0033DB2D29